MPLGRVDDLVEFVAAALSPHLDRPFSFFGIDVGALLMFEVARRLSSQGRRPPSRLFAAGAMAPRVHYLAPIHHLSREAFFATLRQLGIAGDFGAAERALRAECAALATYTYVKRPELEIPVTALVGEQDTFAPRGGVSRGQHETTSTFTMSVVPGGHGMIRKPPAALFEAIREGMRHPSG